MQGFVENVQNKGNIDAAGDYIATDAVDHSLPPGLPPGLEGAKAVFSAIRNAFPDHDAVHEMINEGDLVATRKHASGRLLRHSADGTPGDDRRN